MSEEERWNKVRMIVREECELIAERIVAVLEKHGNKNKLGFKDGRWTGVTEEQMAAWKAAYGAVDVDGELKKAAAWIVSNPHLAPRTQLGRFLNTWFAKTQNTAALRSISGGKVLPGPGKKLCSYCEKVGTGSPNNIWACDDHFRDAMDHTPIPRMKGVSAKAVAGE